MKLSDIRKDYAKHSLDTDKAGNDPLVFFDKWLNEAIASGVHEPTAMAVSTVSEMGKPSSRMVLLKGMDEGMFVFFTNYRSKKGEQIQINPNVSLLFFWPELERQVRIEGIAQKLPGVDSDKYFDSRPLESRIGAIASPQSQVITGREEIEDSFYRVAELFTTSKITRPDHWGGYSVTPECIEFWQGRPGRLHDRIQYRRADNQHWIQERLAP